MSLFFPLTCAGCDVPLVEGESLLCTSCWYRLPYTRFHQDPENRAARQLWGAVPLTGVAAYLYLRDASRVQRMIYRLKYGNVPALGLVLGMRYGEQLATVSPYREVEVVVPVPLHPAKKRRRGYNQSAYFARGLGIALGRPVVEEVLIRSRDGGSQTHKTRQERFASLQDTFMVRDAAPITDRHVLLADDVLTTGATLEACARVLLDAGAGQVSAVTIAKAM